jgi:hypothetical protein
MAFKENATITSVLERSLLPARRSLMPIVLTRFYDDRRFAKNDVFMQELTKALQIDSKRELTKLDAAN